jgi:hypothetical protein
VLGGGAGGQPEVDHAGDAVGRDENVVRLDIAVYQAGPVRGRQRLGDLHADGHHPLLVHGSGGDQVRQPLPGDQVHHQIRSAVDQPHVVHVGDAGMIHTGQQRRFPPELLQRLVVIGNRREHLQRVLVPAAAHPVHHRLRPAAELVEDLHARGGPVRRHVVGRRAQGRGIPTPVSFRRIVTNASTVSTVVGCAGRVRRAVEPAGIEATGVTMGGAVTPHYSVDPPRS